jgi:isocitrate lyase
MRNFNFAAQELQESWENDLRWQGIKRNYQPIDVLELRGSFVIEYSIASQTSKTLWDLLSKNQPIVALGTLTGNQAVQQVKAGLEAIYVSGWQVAADANLSGQMYPDQSLYPANSVPEVVKKINRALQRADQIEFLEGDVLRNWMAPIIADAEAGFGGALNVFELMKNLIESGAAGVHFEDQLASEKKCGHLGGKVLVPTSHFIRTLNAARLAADVMGVPTLLIARTDANGANLITSDIDDVDKVFLTGERTEEGYFLIRGGLEAAIARAISYAPYADLIWCETAKPDLQEAKAFATAVHNKFPGKMLAYNCSPSFNWKKNLSQYEIDNFQKELGEMGYQFQFVTLAGFHTLNLSMFELAFNYKSKGMSAYSEVQEKEFLLEKDGYSAIMHQREVGTSYFDHVAQVISGGTSSTLSYQGSTEKEQFIRQ